ncbi:MAG TPA: SpvB/TcaC N-terminal domain-containing protein [Verrucomicrobiae bacterium]|nr:SpvB/TcaC N-terminal domain-containing protein [Verrucomicrobiae bacterium]
MKARSWTALVLLVLLLLPGGGFIPARADMSTTAQSRGGSALKGAIDFTLGRQPQVTPQALGSGALGGLQYADPTEGLALVEPPTASSQGNATLTQPILIPPGRGGVQPNLDLTYDSSGGDGWLGQGWDLSLGAIEVDTRWGVPRFLPNQESETYVLDGDVLFPNAVRSTLLPRVTDREDFTRRVETHHDRIIRHGTNPKDYWWEVIDKNGAHFWYGGFPDGGGPKGLDPLPTRDDSAILTDDQGNATRWALSAMRDVGVNAIRFHYETVQGTRVGAQGATMGRQLYLKSIRYTAASPASGHPEDPAYEVRLLRDADITPAPAPRRDVVVDARGGFLQVTSDLLRRIEIWYGAPNADESPRTYNILSRAYNLNYLEGEFGKSLLKSVDQVGSDGAVFATNTFDYYDQVRGTNGNLQGFDTPTPWNTQSDNLHEDLIGAVPISALGGSLSNGGGFRIYIGYNQTDPLKDGSFGGGLALKGGASEASAEFMDINGDGLPDKVFRSGGGVSYRLNRSGPGGTTEFDPIKHPVGNLEALSKESFFEFSGGPEAHFVASVQFSISVAIAQGEAYFSDVNSDGLPDFVRGGKVYFNHLENVSGQLLPTFEDVSTRTRVPIDPGAAAAPQLQQLQDLEAQEKARSPLVDTVRRFTAPWSGHVSITGDVTLSPAVVPGGSSDGVRAAIETAGAALWSDTLTSPAETKSPTGVANLAVAKGQAIYFRLGSIDDGVLDQVTWNPTITYQDVTGPLDVNGLSPVTFTASNDFTLAGRPHTTVTMPLDGMVQFDADVTKTAVTSDDVTVLVLKNGVPVVQQTLPRGSVGTTHVSAGFPVAAPVGANRDRIEARLSVDSPIDVTRVGWTPELHYVSATNNGQPVPTTDANGNNTLSLIVPTDTDIYPVDDLGGPQQPYTSDHDGTVNVIADVTAGPSHPQGDVVLTVKGSDGSLAKQPFTLAANTLSGSATLSVALKSGTDYWFDLSVREPGLSDAIGSSKVHYEYNDGAAHSVDVPSARHWAGSQGVFPIAYRGWAYAGYNADGPKATAPLDPAAFVFNPADFPTSDPTGFDDPGYKDPAQGKAYAFIASALGNDSTVPPSVWRGPKDSLHGGPGEAQSSRLKNDSIHLVTATGAGAQAPVRLSVSPSLALTAGVASLGGSFGWGPNLGLLDYMDLNGDGFPDYVSPNQVQYTGPRGGYVDTRSQAYLGVVTNDTEMATGGGVDGSAVEIKANSEARSNTSQAVVPTSGKRGRKRSNTAGKGKTSDGDISGAKMGFSLGLGTSFSNEPATGQASFDLDQETKIADVNGDGLPDRVRVDNDRVFVRLNLGYAFSDTEILWAESRFENGQTVNGTLGPSLGFNFGELEFAGGLSLTEAYTTMKTVWVDVDGDGILDRLRKGDNTIFVSFGTGSGVLPEAAFGPMAQASVGNAVFNSMPLLQGDQVAIGHDTGLGAGFDFTIGIGPLCFIIGECYIILNPGADFERGVSSQEVELSDVDGDGRPDSVFSTADSQLVVRRNLTDRTNLLKAVSNALGGTITLGYERKGNTVDQPASLWALSRVEVDDGRPGDGVNKRITTWEYEGGRSNPLERTDFGFAKVTEKARDLSEAVLRITERAYLNDNIFNAGLQTRETLLDPVGKKIKETISDWKLVDVATNDTAAVAPTAADPANLRLLGMSVAPERTKVEQRWFDSAGVQAKNTWTTYAYDDLANVTQAVDVGEPGIPGDDLTMTLRYSDCTIAQSDDLTSVFACPAPAPAGGHSPFWNPNRCGTWTSLPAVATLTDSTGQILRQRDGRTDLCDNSSVTHLVENINAADVAITDLSYDDWGSYNHIVYPPNATGQRYQVDYVYDVVNRANVGLTADSHAPHAADPDADPTEACGTPDAPVKGCAYSTFDGPTGRIASRLDANGRTTSYTYDAAGRLQSITLPKEQGTGHATVTFEYNPTAPAYAYAVAHHFDAFHPADPIDTVAFADGTGRRTQTKQDASFFRGAAAPSEAGMAVSGAVEYDALGRVVKEWYPAEEAAGSASTYNGGHSAVPTQVQFNLLDLVTRTTHPDGSFVANDYLFGGAPRFGASLFLAHQVDEEGRAQDTYSDVRDNVLGVESRPGTAQALLTRYDSDALGQLYRVQDPAGNVTIHTYDWLGRRTSTNSPDGGFVTFKYDAASNLIEKVTPNLRAKNQKITYRYDFERPRIVSYPDAPLGIMYTYGGLNASENGVGRVVAVHDPARDMTIGYGPMGEVTRETTVMMLHNLSTTTSTKMTFTTAFDEDSFGRYKTVTYPDGEALSYAYDAGGLVSKVTGQKTPFAYPYVDRQEYDAFFARRFRQTGNGVKTETAYDPLTRRVSLIQTNAPPREIQHLAYGYDKVGNVLSVNNPIPFPPGDNTQGGPSTETYTYDTHYRLETARGVYKYADKTRNYTYDVTYDAQGNLKTKAQTDTIFPSKKPAQIQAKTTYTLNPIVYGLPAPHQVAQIGSRAYTHDLDGNVTGWTDAKGGQRRSMTWTADDRMATSADNGSTTTETYDDAGRLAIERGPQGEKGFVNQWYMVVNGSNFWKDVWVGAERIETKKVESPGLPENKRYFLHKDLQGNTNMVTDLLGVPFEHLIYFPGGEVWILEASTTFREPFTFAGAYYDDQRMLLSLGRRWYEPREEYLFTTDPGLLDVPESVLDDPALLPPYTYGENNPIRLADHDGRVPEDVQKAFRAAFGKPGGGLDNASLSAFSSQLLTRINRNGPATAKLGVFLGKVAADPGKAARAGLSALNERLGSKPLLSIDLKKTGSGLQLEEVRVSPTLGFKEFKLKKKK